VGQKHVLLVVVVVIALLVKGAVMIRVESVMT